jgi:tetratricopeptide (TPR) repeat protein
MDLNQRAEQLYREGNLHDALETAQAACERRPKDASAWWLLGCISRHTGLPLASDRAFQRAAELSGRHRPVRVEPSRFLELLNEVRQELPAAAQASAAELEIQVERLPASDLVTAGISPDVPAQRRGAENELTIYQVNLENRSDSEQALKTLLTDLLLDNLSG